MTSSFMKDKIKVLHVVAGKSNSGASRGAHRLHKELVTQGIQSKVLVSEQDTLGDPNIYSIINNRTDKLRKIVNLEIDRSLLKLYPKRNKHIFSTGLGGINLTKHPLYKWANLINLHWINSGFINIKHLGKVKKPIVWTVRDMWPLTGGCHYSIDCEKYKSGCGNCPQLGSTKSYDLSRFVLNRKKKYLPKTMHLVGVSPWLTEEIKHCALFNKYDSQTISSNIDSDGFLPIEKNLARGIIGFSNEKKKLLLIGAQNVNSFYKGFDLLVKSLLNLRRSDFHLVFFGKLYEKKISDLNFTYTSFGFLSDNITLRLLYSAADIFIAPSRQEAFGKTIVEAMSCGTPVVSFDASGYKAQAFDTEDLARGVIWISNTPNYNQLCANAREKVVKEYNGKVIAKKYITLYKDLLS